MIAARAIVQSVDMADGDAPARATITLTALADVIEGIALDDVQSVVDDLERGGDGTGSALPVTS